MSRIWAAPTWYFFHTFAEKINPAFYRHNAYQCFDIIRQICYNLPCPECRYHATIYINKIRYQDVSTKEDLKFVLFTFHNFVNRRLGKPVFTWKQLELYKRANTRKIFKLFLSRFTMAYQTQRDFSGWWRRDIASKTRRFIAQWWHYFS